MDYFGCIFMTEDYSTYRTLTVHFYGTPISTTVTSNPSVVKNWIYRTWYLNRYRLHKLVVGVGVQWHRTGIFDVADTLQLCVGQRCLIFQLTHAQYVPNVLRKFLIDPRTTFVGILNHSDRGLLWRSKHSLQVSIMLQLGCYVALKRRQMRMFTATFQMLASDFLGYYRWQWRDPWVEWSRWDAYWLSDDQIIYATLRAHVAFEIGMKLKIWEPRVKFELNL